jgi:hypothetical protein
MKGGQKIDTWVGERHPDEQPTNIRQGLSSLNLHGLSIHNLLSMCIHEICFVQTVACIKLYGKVIFMPKMFMG